MERQRDAERHCVMPARPPMGRDNGGIQALDRAFLILDIIADAGGEAKLTEIAGIAGLNVSTCHHLISTLYNWGYVARGPNSRSYVLGSRILHLSAACLRQVDLPRRAQIYLDRLNDQTHEAVQLAIMQGTNLVNVLRRESRHAVRVDAGLGGKSNAAHATATGKAILAWLPPSELDRIIADKGLTAFTPQTITDLDRLKEELRIVRRNGVAVDREEFQPGVICIGAAIRDHAGAVVGSISVSSPLFRATDDYVDDIKRHLISATNELSSELGALGAVLGGNPKAIAAE
ncbi:IclR family acetate operon transcriptional repressor [Rhodopseudomonas rhenobacensis]|uniref:IclR family acetate operon transcriptional repressor n=1 Tax=Rhodopseudomonas rhenobacensis TaxID=87461 RepID=A0A7W7Z3J4_9BRAD|nr:IclR family transcriptional regulator [Rhodopseudomonas rhenobacensis]MBB5047289.1 IclR family acetate operon transcriptional repressor [Rhodopseudomonas rhenobacensis]